MNQVIQPAAIRKTLSVRATPEKAFAVFTAGFDRWWPHTHTIDSSPLKAAVIEPREGGRWYGLSEDGTETNWGEVLAWEPPARLLLAWRINGRFVYDPSVHTEVEVRFTSDGDNLTRVDFEHRHLERLGDGADSARAAMDSPSGWGGILERFKAVAET